MKRLSGISIAAVFLLLSACATQPQIVATTGPVNVKVTSETASNQLIRDVRTAALTMIEKQAPNASPMSIDATLYVVYGSGGTGFADANSEAAGKELAYGAFGPDVPTQRMRVPSLSAEPWTDGYIPTVGEASSSLGVRYPSFQPARGPISWMRVSYTITDASGKVIESKKDWVPADRPHRGFEHILPSLYDSARVADTGYFLASRVAALSH